MWSIAVIRAPSPPMTAANSRAAFANWSIPSRAARADELHQTFRLEGSNVPSCRLLRDPPALHDLDRSDLTARPHNLQKPGPALVRRSPAMRFQAKTITVIITVIPPGASRCLLARRSDCLRELAQESSAGRHARHRLDMRCRRHIRPTRGRQDRPEDGFRFPHQNKEMIATRTVRASKPMLHGPLSRTRPVHQGLRGPVGPSEVRDECIGDDPGVGRAAAITVIPARKLLARFRQYFSAPPQLQCRLRSAKTAAR